MKPTRIPPASIWTAIPRSGDRLLTRFRGRASSSYLPAHSRNLILGTREGFSAIDHLALGRGEIKEERFTDSQATLRRNKRLVTSSANDAKARVWASEWYGASSKGREAGEPTESEEDVSADRSDEDLLPPEKHHTIPLPPGDAEPKPTESEEDVAADRSKEDILPKKR